MEPDIERPALNRSQTADSFGSALGALSFELTFGMGSGGKRVSVEEVADGTLDAERGGSLSPAEFRKRQNANWSSEQDSAGGPRGFMIGMLRTGFFELFMNFVIISNICYMVHETDQNAPCADQDTRAACEQDYMLLTNRIFLALYTFEAIIYIYAFRQAAFRRMSFCMDIFIVVSGYVDEILSGLVADALPGPSLAMLKIFRLLRLLRVVHVFRRIPELHAMVRGFISAMRSMLWGFVMIIAFLLLFSLLCVELINPVSLRIHTDNDYCKEAFGSVFYALIFFFQTMVAGDSWGDCLVPIIKEQAWSFVLFGIASVCVSVGLMNLILAVIVEHAARAKLEDEESLNKEKVLVMSTTVRRLNNIFEEFDTDGSGAISCDELLDAYDCSPELKSLFASLDFRREDLERLFRFLDTNNEDEVSFEHLVETLTVVLHDDPRKGITMVRLQVAEIARELTLLGASIMMTQRGSRSRGVNSMSKTASISSASSNISGKSQPFFCSKASEGSTTSGGVAGSQQLSRKSRRREAARQHLNPEQAQPEANAQRPMSSLHASTSDIAADNLVHDRGASGFHVTLEQEVSELRHTLSTELKQLNDSTLELHDSAVTKTMQKIQDLIASSAILSRANPAVVSPPMTPRHDCADNQHVRTPRTDEFSVQPVMVGDGVVGIMPSPSLESGAFDTGEENDLPGELTPRLPASPGLPLQGISQSRFGGFPKGDQSVT